MKTVCITGAAGGIGSEFSRLLISQGYRIILVDKNAIALEGLCQSLPSNLACQVDCFPADLLDTIQVKKLYDRLIHESELHGLINCAGLPSKPFLIDDDGYDEKMINLNLRIPILLTRAAMIPMTKKGSGFIINVCSFAGLVNGFSGPVYNATKSGLISFTQSFAKENASRGITVQALCPGKVATEFEMELETSLVVPKPLLLSVQQVVQESLNDLNKKRVISIPGRAYRLLALFDATNGTRIYVKFIYLLMKVGVIPKATFSNKSNA
ncbi:MAG: SDR family NAD(P)-dependent oxidoreductase [Methylobacter sp.]